MLGIKDVHRLDVSWVSIGGKNTRRCRGGRSIGEF
jgi:hypothetical protein